MTKLIHISCLIFIAVIISTGQESDFPKLSGSYLGQKPPSLTPEPFAANIPEIHRFLHSGIFFSPKGDEAYWKPDWNPRSPIYYSKVENGFWTVPQSAQFSQGNQGDDSPVISPDGKKLFFLSQRTQKYKESIWVVTRTSQGWSKPEMLPGNINSLDYIHWQFSIERNGNIYYGAGGTGNGKEGYIYCSKYINGHYNNPEKLGTEINYPGIYNYSPSISPDGNTLVFTRNQNPATLFISFRNKDGNWTEAIELNKILNCKNCLNPYLTIDGKYLFFLEGGYPYWVSAKIINALRPNE